jgi:GNAT superfamily N-acetyltransferase
VSIDLRIADAADGPFLAEMLVAAAFWRPEGLAGSVREVMDQPDFAHYVAGWPQPSDFGVIAEDVRPVGAAWFRVFPANDPGFGFVDAGIPEVSMGVARPRRGEGIGARLLKTLVAQARDAGLATLCLSVEPDNYARGLYERVGFRTVGAAGGSLTMLLHLEGCPHSTQVP